MTVAELIEKLSSFDPKSEVQIKVENDECDTCSRLTREECSLQGEYRYSDFELSFKPDVMTIEVY